LTNPYLQGDPPGPSLGKLRAQDAGSVRCSPARPRKFTGFPWYLPLAP